VAPETTNYVRKVSLRESDVQYRLREATEKLGSQSVMLSSPEEQQLFQLILHLMNAKKTLDIGVFTGYSSLCQAMALPEDGKVVALDISEEFTSVGIPYWKEAGVFHKIDLRIKPALESLDDLIERENAAGTFDFAFIDADKLNYPNYVEKAYVLLRTGGLIAIDNTLWSGKVYDESVQDEDTVTLRELNAKLVRDKRFEISMATIADGVTFLRKL